MQILHGTINTYGLSIICIPLFTQQNLRHRGCYKSKKSFNKTIDTFIFISALLF